jgi:type IX secretion system PorP/SprF family membrane protein
MMRFSSYLILTICAVLLRINNCSAQDPELTQFYAAPVFTNPAFCGATKQVRITSSVRNQHTVLKDNYQTMVTSIDAYSGNMKAGFGLMFMGDRAGTANVNTTAISGIYSYNLDINRNLAINAALQASYVQSGIDGSRFLFPDMLDKRLGSIYQTKEQIQSFEQKNYINYATGVLIYTSKFYGGLAVHNLFQPNQSFIASNNNREEYNLPRRYTAHFGINLDLVQSRIESKRVSLLPNVLFMNQLNFYQLNIGMYLKDKNINIGGWLRQTSRNTESYIVMIGFRRPNFRIGYSIDFIIPTNAAPSSASHEITIGYEFKTKFNRGKSSRSNYLKDPIFN